MDAILAGMFIFAVLLAGAFHYAGPANLMRWLAAKCLTAAKRIDARHEAMELVVRQSLEASK